MLSLFSKPKPSFERFMDGMGNFEFDLPSGWKYDEDIALVDGSYTISFRSPDKKRVFTVAVDAKIPKKFSFAKYVKAECGPKSGIIAEIKMARFHGIPAYKREYSFQCGSRKHFGGNIIFRGPDKVFSLTWSAPESERKDAKKLFGRMMESFIIKRGFAIKRV